MFGNSAAIKELKTELAKVAEKTATKADLEKLVKSIQNLDIATQHRHADELLTRHGLLIETVHNTYTVLDYEGRTEVIRRCEGLRAIGECTAACIPHYLSTATPSAKILKGPTLVEGHDCEMRILKERSNAGNICRFEIGFRQPLQPTANPVSYAFSTELEKAFVMTQEQLVNNEAEQREYGYRGKPAGENIAFDVNYPVGNLEFHVVFPKSYVPKRVWAGSYFIRENWQTHEMETKRIRNQLKAEGAQIRLTIPRPVLGFRYALHWEPLSAKAVQELKDRG